LSGYYIDDIRHFAQVVKLEYTTGLKLVEETHTGSTPVSSTLLTKEIGMPVPYAIDQEPSCPHGCYYPDITRIRDEQRDDKIIRVSYCTRHGFINSDVNTTHLSNNQISELLQSHRMIPTNEWREKNVNVYVMDKSYVHGYDITYERGLRMSIELNSQVLEMIESNPLIKLIRSFTIADQDEYMGLLVIEKGTPPLEEGEELSAFYYPAYEELAPTAICAITPLEYENIIEGTLALPKEWVLGGIIFEGELYFTEIDKLITSINNWLYPVSIADEPLLRVIGFKCASGRKWKIRLTDLKNSLVGSKFSEKFSLSSLEDKDKFLTFLNTKPPYEET
jgi:hypothetical protein